MAEEIPCPACESPNDPSNDTCEECGAELYERAPVQDDASDGDEFVEPEGDGEAANEGEPAGFEGVEEVRAYDENNPDYGVDEEFVERSEDDLAEVPVEAAEQIHGAVEQGDDELAEIPVEGYEFAEDTGADEVPFEPEASAQGEPRGEGSEQFSGHADDEDEPESTEYELEPLDEDEDDEEAEPEGEEDEGQQPRDDQFDGGAPLDVSPDDTFDEWDDDEVAADGGAPIEPAVSEFAADSEADFEAFAAREDAEFDEAAAEFDETAAEVEAEESEAEQETPPPPELEAILNPVPADRAPIEPLPTPGPYAELATLSVYKSGEELGEIAVDFDCTVLGLEKSEAGAEASEVEEVEAEELYELEPIEEEADEADALDAFVGDDAYELDTLGQQSSELSETSELDEESSWAENDAPAASEVDETPEEVVPYEDPEDLEEGPVVDLSQFGDKARFARRHGYLVRQNKHYTLYVLSDMGTQLNDELLTIGERRELSDGDVIVLGGEVALKFNEPAA